MYDECHATLTASHEYTMADTCTCRLRVTDNEGMTDEATIKITVKNVPGDFDGDRDVDQKDSEHFQACYSGSGTPAQVGSEDAILDADGDVDANDFAVFISCLSGTSNPANPNCVE